MEGLIFGILRYFSQKEGQTRNYHPLKFISAGCRTNIYKYSFFPDPLKNGTNFPKQLLKLPTQRPSSLPWGPRPGMDQPLSIWTLFIFISPAQIHCTSAHSTSTAHTCWRWAVLPFADQTFRFIFKTCSNLHRVFTPEDLFFTCIALRWLNSWLFLETCGSSSNFNQPHKWSGIVKCFSLQKGVFSFRINEWTRSCISLPPLLTIRHICTRRLDFHTLIG